MNRITAFLICFLTSSIICSNSIAENRVALIIGNGAYQTKELGALPNSKNDAVLITNTLKNLGFITTTIYDGSKKEILDALTQFSKTLSSSDVAVFYYSGHGCCINDVQYLVPIANSYNPITLSEEYIALHTITQPLQKYCPLSFIFLDACRDEIKMEAPGSTKAVVTPNDNRLNNGKPTGQVRYYATGKGKVATVGSGSISPFTEILAQYLTDIREFRSVWPDIQHDVYDISGKMPCNEESYTNSFYFNKDDKYNIYPPKNNSNKKSLTFFINPSSGKITFGSKSYSSGTSLIFEKGETYHYTVDADGYISQRGSISINDNSVDQYITLKKSVKATVSVTSNVKQGASVYWDGIYKGETKGNKPLTIETETGQHKLKLTANHYYNKETTCIVDDAYESEKVNLQKKTPEYFDNYGYDYNIVNYHFSPLNPIGFSFMRKIESSRFSYGAYVALSPYLFKNMEIKNAFVVSQTIAINIGNLVPQPNTHISNTVDYSESHYSEDADPYNEAEHHNGNLLLLGNAGFNLCDGIMIEAGAGVLFHSDKYYMNNTYSCTIEYDTDDKGNIIESTYAKNYTKQNKSKWYSENAKTYFATRIGARFLIPIGSYCRGIQIGGGYTYVPGQHSQSTWDATIGYCWEF